MSKPSINVLQLIKEKKQKEDRRHQAKLLMAMR
jgi:hypothetical protein